METKKIKIQIYVLIFNLLLFSPSVFASSVASSSSLNATGGTEEYHQGRGPLKISPIRLSAEHQAIFEKVDAASKNIPSNPNQGYDVHAYNRQLKPYIQDVLNIASEHLHLAVSLNATEVFLNKLNQVAEEIGDSTQKAHIQRINSLIRSYMVCPGAIEPQDTGLNMPTLFSYLTELADRSVERLKLMSHVDEKLLPRLGESPELFIWRPIVDRFSENISTNGGCYAGVAGRTFREFLVLVNEWLGRGEALRLQ